MNDDLVKEVADPMTGAVIGAAIEVHRALGPGLLESVYEKCLRHELSLRGIQHNHQVELPIVYKDLRVERSLIIDILVDSKVVVELKATEGISKVHEAQILTYLKLTGLKTGLIMNFNVPLLKNGIKRYSI